MTSQGSRAHSQARRALMELLHPLTGPVLVHVDVFRTGGVIPKVVGRHALLSAHFKLLLEAAGQRPIWMPTFNYDFVRTGTFAVRHDVSQVGALTEHFRKEHALWRTPVPIFSVAGTAEPPNVNSSESIDPFGSDSVFAQLAKMNGSILFYGADIRSCTFVHYAERAAGGPVYRYDKVFRGTVTTTSSRAVTLSYHVRPRGHHLDYDWVRLEHQLFEHGLLRRFNSGRFSVASIEAANLLSFWSDRLAADPLYLLDDASRAWVKPKIDELGRGFLLEDFESYEQGEHE